jgi:TRAP-type C4-dicarboxylate transport system permease small subunit
VMFFTGLMPAAVQRFCLFISEGLVAIVSVFMADFGYGLCTATWYSSIDAFPALSVGVTYLPIPIGGAITLLFVIERLTIGSPPPAADLHGALPVD